MSIASGPGMSKPGNSPRWLALAGWLTAVLLVGYVGSAILVPKIPNWYAGIAKPAFTPPPIVFSTVWTMLYLMMAVAVWRVGGVEKSGAEGRWATRLFVVQLALNGLWSPVFFGLQNLKLGLVVTVALFVVLIPTTLLFLRLDRIAGFLLVPYLAWVGFALVLNAAIVVLN